LSATNYDSVIDQLKTGGLQVDRLEVGRIVRCRVEGDRGRQKTGWYSLHELMTGQGELLLVGAFGNWREGVDGNGRPVTHRIELRGREMSAQEKAAIRARIHDEKKRAEGRRRAEQQRAARRAEKWWKECTTEGSSDYLVHKGVHGYGARYSPTGNLVLPIHDNHGRIHGLQVIYSDPAIIKRKGRDKDFMPAGLAKRGNYMLIGAPSWIVLVAEGYATACSLHEATGHPVAVAWDAGNLLPVCQALKHRYREAKILVCADDDYKTDGNPGVSAASAASMAVSGAWIKPEFADRGENKWTDFNDLHQAEHIDKVRAQLEGKVQRLGWSPVVSRADRTSGEAGAPVGFLFSLDVLIDHYVLIYGTETVFDGVRKSVVTLSSLRSAAGKSLVRMWLEHPSRRVVLPDQVVFDPTDEIQGEKCNLWDAWPTKPRSGSCERLLELLEYLCSKEDNPSEVFDWVMKWIAYPIQFPGTKMQTALLIHGPEGTGKNTYFNGVRALYGKYGGNEVVTRVELYHQQGRLKNMITESEWTINEKNLPTRPEQNHCNFVFFSNRIDIAKLDKDDRRYCVIWTPPALSQTFMDEVYAEIKDGGREALHDHLLNLDLGDFKPYTKPPTTRAKRELIELGMDSIERFWRDWSEERIPVPFTACRSDDFYELYRYWAQRAGIPKAAPAHVLVAMVNKKAGVSKRRARYYMGQKLVQSTFIIPDGAEPPEANAMRKWLSEQIEALQNALNDWREGLSA
jgi:putative DNA primase/helicase